MPLTASLGCQPFTRHCPRRRSCSTRSQARNPCSRSWRPRVVCTARSNQPCDVVASAPSSATEVEGTSLQRAGRAATALALAFTCFVGGAYARLEGVNKPELLPKEPTPIIDVAGFLTPGEEARIRSQLEALEQDTGIKLRVLAQNYPDTPGLAVRDFWKVDDNTVVFVADPTFKNILNFNVGSAIDLTVPPNFWTRLAGKYGTKFYWQDRGQEAAIVNAVSAINTCMREPPGKLQCSKIQSDFGEESSSGPYGKTFFGS